MPIPLILYLKYWKLEQCPDSALEMLVQLKGPNSQGQHNPVLCGQALWKNLFGQHQILLLKCKHIKTLIRKETRIKWKEDFP